MPCPTVCLHQGAVDGVRAQAEPLRARQCRLRGVHVAAREMTLRDLAQHVAIDRTALDAPLERLEGDVHPALGSHNVREPRHRPGEIWTVRWTALQFARAGRKGRHQLPHAGGIRAGPQAGGTLLDENEGRCSLVISGHG